jgi:hypothetical protein
MSLSDQPVSNVDVLTALGHTLTFSQGGVLSVDGVPVDAGSPSSVTAAGATNVTVTQTGTGAILVTGNATGGIDISCATDGAIAIGTSANLLGFYGTTPIAQPSAAAVTTVAEVLTLLESLGLCHS